jgi:hypothetical protein
MSLTVDTRSILFNRVLKKGLLEGKKTHFHI